MTQRYTAFHWGIYQARRLAGQGAELLPLPNDPAPSRVGEGVAAVAEAPARIRVPHVRAGWRDRRGRAGEGAARGREPFLPVSWDEALDLVADELRGVIAARGNDAIFAGSYGWASAGRFHQPQTHLQRFLGLIGGYTRSVNAYSYAAAEVILPHVIGSSLHALHGRQARWTELAEHAELIVSFGGLATKNAQVGYGLAGPHRVRSALEQFAARGIAMVTLSPSRADVPDGIPAQWLSLRPNTDTAVMLALAHVLVVEDLWDRDFVARCTTGFAPFRDYLLGQSDGLAKTPEWASAIADIPAGEIRTLARRMASARTFIALSWSIQRGDHGEQPIWAGIALAALIGQIGLPGGGFGLGHGCSNEIGQPGRRLAWASLPRTRNPIDSFIPVARFTDMLLRPGEPFDYDGRRLRYPHVDLVYWAGGNPFHHQQDINRLLSAWRRPRTIVVNEAWWTATARHADVVLPVTTPLERNDIGATSGEATAVAMRQVLPAPGEARSDFAIFAALADRFGVAEAFTEGLDELGWLERLYEQSRTAATRQGVDLPPFVAFWEQGLMELPAGDPLEPMFAAFRRDPVGDPLATPSGRIEIASETIAAFGYADCVGHPAWFEPAEWLGATAAARFPLHLISSQPPARLHSQYDHAQPSRATKIAGREPITLHPDDAAARGIAEGDIVRVYNDRGACLAGATLSAAMRPGVVRLATGAWYDPARAADERPLDAHGNPNLLTRDKGTSSLAQGPTAMTALVEVERFTGEPPPITVFDPPVTLN